jgi:predicted nucleic acid-binding protein
MLAMRFVDTNVLLYRISNDPAEAAKAAIATEILRHPDLCLSVQVLQEFYVQATRPSSGDPLTHQAAVELISTWKRFPIQELTVTLLDSALDTKERWGISYWDAAIVEAARALHCRELLSEDLSDGQDYGGVRVVNPFA